MHVKTVTYCFAQGHYETCLQVLPNWCDVFGSENVIVGFYDKKATNEFIDRVTELGVNAVALQLRFYGEAYQVLLEQVGECDAVVILAPYVIPSEWLIGSVVEWMSTFALVGRFKPPRVLNSERLLLPLISPVIVELGRLNLDFLAIRSDVRYLANFLYRDWEFGSILVRARPGAQILFNLLSLGYPILTLPNSVKPVKYIISRRKSR